VAVEAPGEGCPVGLAAEGNEQLASNKAVLKDKMVDFFMITFICCEILNDELPEANREQPPWASSKP
jgi:hypothetical protein